MLAVGVYMAVVVDLHPLAVAVVLVLMGGYAWWVSPLRRGRHTGHVQAHERAADDDVIAYWKPGCRYCSRLMRGLGDRIDQVIWVNTNVDNEAAAYVASLNAGNVLTPTVVTGAGRQIEATPDAVTEHVERSARR